MTAATRTVLIGNISFPGQPDLSSTPLRHPADCRRRSRSKNDANSLVAHSQLIEKARKGGIDIYFEGDSITRRWGADGLPSTARPLEPELLRLECRQLGWGADRIQNILWRLNSGELDNVNPKIVVLLAGTNNVGSTIQAGTEDTVVADVTKECRLSLRRFEASARSRGDPHRHLPRNDNLAVMP